MQACGGSKFSLFRAFCLSRSSSLSYSLQPWALVWLTFSYRLKIINGGGGLYYVQPSWCMFVLFWMLSIFFYIISAFSTLQIGVLWGINIHLYVWILHLLLCQVEYEWFLAALLLCRLQCLYMLCILPDAGSYKFSRCLDFRSPYLRCCQKRMSSSFDVYVSIIIWREESNNRPMLVLEVYEVYSSTWRYS